jgi:DNA-binding CsgD family transcriptional regulator
VEDGVDDGSVGHRRDDDVAAFVLRLRDRLHTPTDPGERSHAFSDMQSWQRDAITPAERRVLDLLTTNMSLGVIARRLFVSRATVKTHARSIYRKLGVSSRGQAVDRAFELGVIQSSPDVLHDRLVERISASFRVPGEPG